jgi:hypothetical protein
MPCLLGCTGSKPCWHHHPLILSPSGFSGPQLHVGWSDPCPSWIPTSWVMPDPCLAGTPTLVLHQIHTCWNPRPSSPLPLRLCWTPAQYGPTGTAPCWEPYPSWPGTNLAWDNHILHPSRTPDPCMETGPSSTDFPDDNGSTRILLWPPLEGSKRA